MAYQSSGLLVALLILLHFLSYDVMHRCPVSVLGWRCSLGRRNGVMGSHTSMCGAFHDCVFSVLLKGFAWWREVSLLYVLHMSVLVQRYQLVLTGVTAHFGCRPVRTYCDVINHTCFCHSSIVLHEPSKTAKSWITSCSLLTEIHEGVVA